MSAALRLGFEDAYTYLGGPMVDPMWAGAARAGPSRVDEAKAAAAIDRLVDTSTTFIAQGGALARAAPGTRVPPR